MLNDKNNIISNLKDADCTQDTIEQVLTMEESGNIKGLLKILHKHKKNLLDSLHKKNKQIDCLDYLIFKIEQESKGI